MAAHAELQNCSRHHDARILHRPEHLTESPPCPLPTSLERREARLARVRRPYCSNFSALCHQHAADPRACSDGTASLLTACSLLLDRSRACLAATMSLWAIMPWRRHHSKGHEAVISTRHKPQDAGRGDDPAPRLRPLPRASAHDTQAPASSMPHRPLQITIRLTHQPADCSQTLPSQALPTHPAPRTIVMLVPS